MSDHHLLLQIQMLIAALQVIMNDVRDLERRVQESQTVDEAAGPTPEKSARQRRQPLRFAIAAGAVAKTCFACQREVLQQPVDGRLLNADGTEYSQTCTLRHLMGGGQNRARAQPRNSKSSTARKRSKRSVG